MDGEDRHDLEKARLRYAIGIERSRTRETRERTLPTDHSHAALAAVSLWGDAGTTREYQRGSSSKRPVFSVRLNPTSQEGEGSPPPREAASVTP
jgi:hypothetical protein